MAEERVRINTLDNGPYLVSGAPPLPWIGWQLGYRKDNEVDDTEVRRGRA